jgi:integrase
MNGLAIRNKEVSKALAEVGRLRSPRYAKQVSRTFLRYQTWAENRPEESVIVRLESYAQFLSEKGLSAGTIGAYLGHLKLVIKRLAKASGDLGLLRDVSYALDNVDRPKAERGEQHVQWLSDAEARLLLDSLSGDTLEDLRDKVVFALMLGVGLRRSELASLRWVQLVQENGIWLIANISSKGRVRTVPIANSLYRCLRRLATKLGEPTDTMVLLSIRKDGSLAGNGLSSGAVREIVKRRAAAVGLTVTPHDLRRTFARFAWLGGMALPDLAKLLGHSSVKTTERYVSAGFSPDRLLPTLPWSDALNGREASGGT